MKKTLFVKLSILLMMLGFQLSSHAQTTTFNFNGTTVSGGGTGGSPQAYTVPCGVTSISVDMKGGKGGFPCCSWTSPGSGPIANGGRVQCTMNVTPGQVLYIYVGGGGTDNYDVGTQCPGGWNGGGTGGDASGSNGFCAGGGGASDIRTSSTGAYATSVLVVAGGGGGGGDFGPVGGAGGGTTGGAGAIYTSGSAACGGTQTGAGCSSTYAGSQGQGGACVCYSDGGGGGGWWGGNGGTSDNSGAGGSSYPATAGGAITAITHTQGYSGATGNGQVIIIQAGPNVVTTPSALSFGVITTGVTSSVQTFSMTGTSLTSSPVTVGTTNSAFPFSFDGTTWYTTPQTYSFTVPGFTNIPIYVKFSPTSAITYTGNITVSGGGLVCTVNTAVTGTGAALCTGTPVAGTASITPTSGGTSTSFTLSLTGTTVSGGLVYDWQSSPTGAPGSFSDMSGGSTSPYTFTGISTNTYFQAVVTCPSYTPATSNTVAATFVLAAPLCIPTYSQTCYIYPMNTSIASLTGYAGSITDPSNFGATTASCPTSYIDNSATMNVTMVSGVTYTPTLNVSATYYSSFTIQAWIDFNDDGTFASTESIGGINNPSNSTPTCSFVIPAGANPGIHRMRIVGVYGSTAYPGIPPCISSSYGNSRDYKAIIIPPCSNPPTSTGNLLYCTGGGTSTLTNPGTVIGTWSSSNTSVASVAAGTGVVTGGTLAGTARISYIVPGGCQSNVIVTVNTKPTIASVTPSATTICTGLPLTFTAGAVTGTGAVTAYTWSGPNSYSATSATSPGIFTPTTTAATGIYSATVSYSGAGCTSNPATTSSITVPASPGLITGTPAVCQGSTTPLGNSVPGGAWSTTSSTLASISSTGVVSGLSAGLANITYTTPNTCVSALVVSVNPLPVLNITPVSASATICQGSNTSFTANSPLSTFSLLSQDFNSGLSGWSVVNGTGTATSQFHIVSPPGFDAIAGDGSPMLQASGDATTGYTYTKITSPSFSTIGYGSATLTFNEAMLTNPPDDTIRVQYSIDNGNSWSTLLDELPLIYSGSGAWSAASPEENIALPAAAIGQANVKLRWNYHASAFYWYIDNISVNGYLPPATYAWSTSTDLSCNTCTTPTITPTTTGAHLYNIAATSFAGCVTTNTVTVNVNPLPTAIVGNTNLCVGTTTTLNSTPGGAWTSSTTSVAPIGGATGVITGNTIGITTISYTLPTSCATATVVTVIPAPAAITGANSVCTGLTTTLSQSVSGGTWSSSNAAQGSINTFGVVTGVASGVPTITYTLPSGCTTTKPVTVNPSPNAIGGTPVVCEGATVPLSETSVGGAWSSSATANATVSGTGVVSGILAGNSFITYTLPTTCFTTTIATINQAPAAISSPGNVCVNAQVSLSSGTLGGTWTSSITANAVVNSSGVVTGIASGASNIVYTLSSGCSVSSLMVVNALPALIGGTTNVCKNSVTTLTDGGSGAWSSGSSSIATVDAGGNVFGVTAGNTNITYTLSGTGCKRSTAITVNPLPAAINGTPIVCETQSTSLADFTPGGVWSSAATYIASVDATGTLTGAVGGAGNTLISYTLPATGCAMTVMATVNAQPAAISAGTTFAVCKDQSIGLSDITASGAWTSGNISIASVDAGGTVTGVTAGNVNITYMLPTGCAQTAQVTVNALPATISGNVSVCQGATTPYTDATTGITWSSVTPAIADVDATGNVTGNTQGVATIVVTNNTTGCARTKDITVNPTPLPVTGGGSVCQGLTATVGESSTGGVWSSSASSTASVDASGTVTGNGTGTANIIYTLPQGCAAMTQVTVNPLPLAISGPSTVCQGLVSPLTDGSNGGTWSSLNSSVAFFINPASGIVTGATPGTATVVYMLPTGCSRSRTMTVNPQPSGILGNTNVCQGLTTTLGDPSGSGNWTSTVPTTASVNSAGTVTGLLSGNTTIIFTLPTGCLTSMPFTVNPQPAAISGAAAVCPGLSTSFTSGTSGVIWTSSNSTVASVSSTGTVTGGTQGNAVITTTIPGTGCFRTRGITVNPAPGPITGNSSICIGQTTSLGNSSVGGSWSSSAYSVASVNSSGLATGTGSGFAIITYTLPTGCINTSSLVVNALPSAIGGNAAVCAGAVTTLTDGDSGGIWSTSSAIANVSASGDVTGVAAGTTLITYSLGTGCQRTITVTVNQLPALITGASAVCRGSSTLFNNDNTGGTWSSNDMTTATVDATTGAITGMSAGNTNIVYTLPTGCMRSKNIIVNTPAAPITGTASACAGSTTSLSSLSTGGMWTSGNTVVATIDPATGMVSGIMSGNANITYTLPTGCSAMSVVNINALPPAIAGTMSICQGAAATLSNAMGGGTWASSDATTASVGSLTGTVTAAAAGSAMVTYTSAAGCQRMATFVVNPLPSVNAVTGGGSYCQGGTGKHIGLDGSQTATTYSLAHGVSSLTSMAGNGGVIDFGPFTGAGVYTVSATSSLGCSSNMSGTATINIDSLVPVSVTVTSSAADTVCQGTSVTYTANPDNGGTAPSYVWSVGSSSALGTSPSFTYTPANGDVVTATLTSNINCPVSATASAARHITVMDNLAPSVNITVAPGNKLCQGSSATFVAVPVNGGTTPAYTWTTGGRPSTVTGALLNYMPINGDIVVCKLTSSYMCPTTTGPVQSNTITMEVDSIHIPVVSIIANPGTVVQKGQNVTFTTVVGSAGADPTYQWLINGHPTGVTTATFQGNNFNDGDSVTCVVTGTGSCGYATINSVEMHVIPVTGVAQVSNVNSTIILIPNPNNGGFTVSGTLGSAADEEVSLEVTDVLGQVVYRGRTTAKGGAISERIQLGNNIANGMYLLNLRSGSEQAVFHFVVKQ